MSAVYIDWDMLPVQEIEISKLVFDCHELHPEHVHVTDPDLVLSLGPIHLQALIDGSYWILNGRHRTLRKLAGGGATILARVYNP